MATRTITPLLIFGYYKNIEYTEQDVNELIPMLSEDEFRRYQKMKGNTTKQKIYAIATLIDLSFFKK